MSPMLELAQYCDCFFVSDYNTAVKPTGIAKLDLEMKEHRTCMFY